MNDFRQISELYHDGIKGMKWGIRRYQNYDGTLTEEGKRRYNKGAVEVEKELQKEGKEFKAYKGKDGNYYYKDKKGEEQLFKVRSDQLSDTELVDLNRRVKQENELHKETSNAYEYKGPKADQAFRDASRLAKDISDALPKGTGKTIKKDYSNLSDQELRNRIQRLQLEDSYGKLSGDTKYVKSGSEKAREVLQTAGALLAVAGSAAALALTIKQLREKPSMSQSDILDKDENSLEHHGIKGQKWGLRRYQNDDGTLTEAGRLRYGGKTHVSELDDDELDDLNEAIRYQHKKKLAIGIGVAVTAAAAIVGATWIAKKRQETPQQLQTQQVLSKAEIISKSPQHHMHQPDTVKSNLLALPAPKVSSSNSKPNIPDWLNKSGNSKVKVSTLALQAPAKKNLLAPKSSYDHRKVGKGVFYNNKRNYSRYEYFKDAKGTAHRILKSELRSVPRIHINHHDMSDYLTFRAIYHAMIFGIGYYASDELYHHGIKGQKWGVRRYQDVDGSLTPEGRQRYRADKGTQEILDNSSKFSTLTKKQRNEIANYGRISGGKRGFLAGLAGGATLGLGKTILDLATSKEARSSSSRAIVNRFTRNIMLGAFGGSVVGTLVGSVAGKKSAQAQYADRGRVYVEELLNTPTKRIRGR